MQKTLLIKAALTAALALALLVPLEMIHNTVGERQARQATVVREVAASLSGAQTLGGPVLVFPYALEWTETVLEDIANAPPGTASRVQREHQRRSEGRWVVLPSLADWSTHATTDFKRRGLFKALVYDLTATVTGRFEVSVTPALPGVREGVKVTWGTPFVSVFVSDTRGLASTPQLTLDGAPLNFRNGSGLAALPDGIRADAVALKPGAALSLPFSLTLAVRGTEAVDFLPLAETTRVAIDSPWPHPSFDGAFLPLPRDRAGTVAGFSARWEVTALATKAPAAFTAAAREGRAWERAYRDAFGVRFIEPINVYSMADRALKYGFLFVALSFAAFFLFELLKSLRIHPAQYLLVGLALAIFFLLLLSLSEQVPFTLAYAFAAGASIALQGFYLSHVLGSARRGLGFAGLLAALFAALYGLLINEDTALLMGSLLLFGLLALVMVITRQLDWYSVGATDPGRATAPAGRTPD
ncbi:cell envelope integrity protein CreD [uncultured Thiodictyon sp.]|uniref:cell envelope integrity protein CreD n=1 Tax=uncultured Thiodictyon sp. TaxID=1846217 RepID=UPI0025D707D6|nr:cell envelope integrity protein CreD [uncultured Thiodictyon sp.]